MNRAFITQGVMLQGGLALLLLLMAFLSRNDPRWLAAYLWSLVMPLGTSVVFMQALTRTQRLAPEDAARGERVEGKRAMSRLGVVFTLWIAGLLAIVFLL